MSNNSFKGVKNSNERTETQKKLFEIFLIKNNKPIKGKINGKKNSK